MNNRRNWLFQNIANGITILGLILSVLLIVIAISSPFQLWIIVILAFLIGLTDFLDGKIARRFEIKSSFGSATDRLRDKIFVCSALIILLSHNKQQDETLISSILFIFNAFFVITIILLEILIFSSWLYGLIKGLNVNAQRNGKIKMFLEFFAIMIWLICVAIEMDTNLPIMKFSIYPIDILLIFIIFYAIKSLNGYYQRYFPNAKQKIF